MSIPRNLGNFADNVNTNGKVEVTGINATGTPSASTALLGNGTWGTVSTSPAGSTGQVQYNNAGAFGAISSGTSGQVLTSAGSGAAPTWSTPSAGAMVLISSQTVSSAVTYVTFSNVFSSTYNNYVIVFNGVAFSTSYGYSSGILQAQFQRNGSFVTTGYFGAYGNVWGASISALDEAMSVGQASKANDNTGSGILYCYGINSIGGGSVEGRAQKFQGYTVVNNANSSWAQLATPDAVTTGIRFLVESTNTTIAQGSFYVYGIAKS